MNITGAERWPYQHLLLSLCTVLYQKLIVANLLRESYSLYSSHQLLHRLCRDPLVSKCATAPPQTNGVVYLTITSLAQHLTCRTRPDRSSLAISSHLTSSHFIPSHLESMEYHPQQSYRKVANFSPRIKPSPPQEIRPGGPALALHTASSRSVPRSARKAGWQRRRRSFRGEPWLRICGMRGRECVHGLDSNRVLWNRMGWDGEMRVVMCVCMCGGVMMRCDGMGIDDVEEVYAC